MVAELKDPVMVRREILCNNSSGNVSIKMHREGTAVEFLLWTFFWDSNCSEANVSNWSN